METVADGPRVVLPPGIRELPIVGGHRALDFANTVDDPLGPLRFDHIADYPALLAWGVRVGLLPDRPAAALATQAEQPAGATAVRRAASLRTATNETFGAVVEGRPTAGGWDQLRPFVTRALEQARLAREGTRVDPVWDFAELESPLWPIAEAAYRLLTGPELPRLKRCAGCPWLFLDQSRNGSRRWCSMEFCGTDEKIRRYVTRRAERRTRS